MFITCSSYCFQLRLNVVDYEQTYQFTGQNSGKGIPTSVVQVGCVPVLVCLLGIWISRCLKEKINALLSGVMESFAIQWFSTFVP